MSVAATQSAIDLAGLRTAIGRKVVDHDVATLSPMACLIATFDRDDPAPKPGDAVPPGWHHAYFPALSRKATLGLDGLPTESDILPKMPLPRRMFAGVNLTFHDTIRIGEAITRETELTDITARTGSTGTLIFTTMMRRISTPRGLAAQEEYLGVFREEAKAGAAPVPGKRDEAPAGLPWQRTINADVVSLFRFSALTFNPHRIHYDRGYAMETEGYPGLVVHGPYSQQCLMDFARDHTPGKTMRTFNMRARAPLFDTAPFTLVGRPTGDGGSCEVWALTPEKTIAMQATVTFS
jgi:3-methylfumaryl-CoA hydratase